MVADVGLILAALLPILLVLISMIFFQWSGSAAGLLGWGAAGAAALFIFGGDFRLLWIAFGKGFLLAFFVLYIIWMALLLYHVTSDAGAIQAIGQELPRMTANRGEQALLLAWVFGSFLQGASGFGVPAAVVAPLLVGLGFLPAVAVVVALIGHAWAVTYGSLGSSFLALTAAAGVEGDLIAGPVALFMGMCCLLCGLFVLWQAGGWGSVRRRWPVFVLTGLSMIIGQYLIAILGFWTLASFGAGLVGLIVMVGTFHLSSDRAIGIDFRLLWQGFWPYFVMTIVIVLGETILANSLAIWIIKVEFPAVTTARGFSTPAEAGRAINLFGHPGALLLYSSLIIFWWYRWRGTLPTGNQALFAGQIAWKTVQKSVKSTVAIVALVSMGTTMQHAGMTQVLADALSQSGPLFPFLSPFIGALGAFVTGSNTNSNVVFAGLQRQTAESIRLSVPLILAAQTAGGALGSAFAPAKIIVGVSTVEGAQEGRVMRTATLTGLTIVLIIGLVTLVFAG